MLLRSLLLLLHQKKKKFCLIPTLNKGHKHLIQHRTYRTSGKWFQRRKISNMKHHDRLFTTEHRLCLNVTRPRTLSELRSTQCNAEGWGESGMNMTKRTARSPPLYCVPHSAMWGWATVLCYSQEPQQRLTLRTDVTGILSWVKALFLGCSP